MTSDRNGRTSRVQNKARAKTTIIHARKKYCKRVPFFALGLGHSLGGGEAQGVVISFEFKAEGFDDEVVVVALCQAGDRDRANDACAGNVNGEAAAVRGVVGVGEPVAFAEGPASVFKCQADGVGRTVEARDNIGLTLNPAGVVRRAAERGVEERLVGLAEAADVDHDGLVAGEGEFPNAKPETPGGVVVEIGKEEFGFLADDRGEVFGEGHGA